MTRVTKSRKMRCTGHIAHMREMRNGYRILVEEPEEKRPLGRRKGRWENCIKMDLKEMHGGGVDWIRLAQVRVKWRDFVNTVMNLRLP
jgi:hypothetical protein